MKRKAIGILGGMGPESTALFYQKVIEQCQKRYGAQYDEDYPEIFIYSFPAPGGITGTIKNRSELLNALVEGVKKLEAIGVDFIVILCNSVHYFFEDLRKEVSIPMLSMIEETADKIKLTRYKKVGLFAAEGVIKNKIYDKELKKNGTEVVIPKKECQDKVIRIILNILKGKKLTADKKELKQIAQKLIYYGAEAVILGCTEIPILLKQEDTKVVLFDAVEILAESTVKFAMESQ